jgi:hypothetical protein
MGVGSSLSKWGNKRAILTDDETMRGNMLGGYPKFDAQMARKCSGALVLRQDKSYLGDACRYCSSGKGNTTARES